VPIKLSKLKAYSNKTQTLPKNSKSTVPKPFIDKIAITVFPEPTKAHEIYMAFQETFDDNEVFKNVAGGKKNGFTTARRIALDALVDPKKYPFLQLKYYKEAQYVEKLRLEFVPIDLGEVGMEQLDIALGEIMDDGWAYLRAHGKVTRLDVTIDLPMISMDSFLYLPQQGLTMRSWKVNGQLETATYGRNTGNQTIIYDRGAKRKAKGQSTVGKTGVRVERRITKSINMSVQDLVGLQNPFAGLKFTQNLPSTPPPETKENQWLQFCDSVNQRGLSNALALLPAERKTAYRKYVAANPKPWWQPDAIWEHWPSMLKGINFIA
jgi:hypothetical protein